MSENVPPENLPIINKITFGGELVLTKPDDRRGYKGKLFEAKSGQLIYSKIRLKQGSYCIVPHEIKWVAVSNEYPVYEINETLLLPTYFDLVLRCNSFQKVLDGLAHGGGTKTRIHPEQFEELIIPIPPLDFQQALVQKWHQMWMEINEGTKQQVELERSALSTIRNTLGNSTDTQPPRPKYFAVNWSNIGRWGVEICWRENQSHTGGLFPTVSVREVCKMGSGGTPSRKVQAYYEGGQIPWVKTSEVLNDVITNTEEKITELGLSESAAKLYPQGSILVAMYGQGATRGRTAKLGIEATTNQACCVLYDFDDRINADYLWFYLMSEYDNLRSLASGNNQPNLNADMIGSYPVPLPPLELQCELIEKVRSAKQEAQLKKQKIDNLKMRVTSEIEAAILGM